MTTSNNWIWMLAALALLLTGCPGGEQADSQADSAVLEAQAPLHLPASEAAQGGVVRLPLEIAVDDPLLAAYDFSDPRLYALARAVELPLTRARLDGSLAPGLAESWQSSDGGLTWRFNLCVDSAQEGEPGYLGEQLKGAWYRLLVGEAGPLQAQLADLVQGADDVAKGRSAELTGLQIEGAALVVSLTRPNVVFPEWASQPGLGLMGADDQTGYGPFYVAGIEGNELKLAPNPASLAGAPKLDELVFVCEPDRAKQFELYKAGELATANLSRAEALKITPADPETGVVGSGEYWQQAHKVDSASLVLGIFNHNNYPWADEKFFTKDGLRGGLNYSLNQQYVADNQAGQLEAWVHFLPPVFRQYIDPALLAKPTYELYEQIDESADALYASDHEQGGKLPQGMKTAYLTYEHLARVAKDAIPYWEEAAIKTQPYPVNHAQMVPIIRAGGPGGHDIILKRVFAAYPDPDAFAYTMFHSKLFALGGNWSMLIDEELTAELETTQATQAPNARQKLYHDLTRQIEERSLCAFIGQATPILLINPQLAGYRLGAYDYDASLPAQDFGLLGWAATQE